MRSGKVILFDLGGVLIENNGRAALTAMLTRPLEAHEMWRKWLDSPVVREFERGRTSADEFAASFVREWEIDLDPAVFISEFATWPVGLFDGAEALLRAIKGTHHLACLSNTNAIHWQRFPELHGLFDSAFLSHQIGHIKPDREAFEYTVGKLDVAPQQVYFFDDLEPNVSMAREVGMNAYQVRDFAGIAPILRNERLLQDA